MAETATLSAPVVSAAPTAAEKFFFETNGYIVLENFLKPDHVARLLAAQERANVRRRQLHQGGAKQTGFVHTKSEKSIRFFYLLDDDPLFLELLDWPALMPYVHAFINPKPHHHGSDSIVEHGADFADRKGEWHIDGHDDGYRNLGAQIPMLQLKVGYYLSDMTAPWQGNLTIVPGSHKANLSPSPEDRARRDFFPGTLQVCAPPGTAILFHNALWHTAAPFNQKDGARKMLYYAYEHPWMVGSQEHWGYTKEFYNQKLSPAQRKLFHGFVFDPPEQRWG